MIKKIFPNMGIVRRNIYIPHIYVYYQHARYKYIYIYCEKEKSSQGKIFCIWRRVKGNLVKKKKKENMTSLEIEYCIKYSIDCFATTRGTKKEAFLHYEISCNWSHANRSLHIHDNAKISWRDRKLYNVTQQQVVSISNMFQFGFS